MSKKKQKRSLSQTMFWLMSLLLAGSMVISLIIVALPGPPEPTPTPLPTWTPLPTRTPTSTPTETSTPTPTATQAPIGPSLPTGTTTPEPGDTPIGPAPPTNTPAAAAAALGKQANAVSAAPDTPSPTSTATPVPRLTFAIAGDSRGDPVLYRQLLDSVVANGHSFLIHTGDLVNKGTEKEWQVYDGAMEGFSLPFYPVPGNHDGLDGKLDGYLAHTGVPAHYSFDSGQVHFTLADSHNGGISAAELAWLRQDLQATDRPVTIVVLHHPPFDPDGTDHIMAYGNDPFMALMDELDVDLVVAGHIHAYSHAERDGVEYYITGGAGASLYAGDHPQAFHHYLSVTVVGEEVTVDVVKL